jgi:hypothetical protein
MDSGLLRESDAAERLGVTKRFLQSRRAADLPPAFIRCGRAIRYHPADLERFIEENRVSPMSDRGREMGR